MHRHRSFTRLQARRLCAAISQQESCRVGIVHGVVWSAQRYIDVLLACRLVLRGERSHRVTVIHTIPHSTSTSTPIADSQNHTQYGCTPRSRSRNDVQCWHVSWCCVECAAIHLDLACCLVLHVEKKGTGPTNTHIAAPRDHTQDGCRLRCCIRNDADRCVMINKGWLVGWCCVESTAVHQFGIWTRVTRRKTQSTPNVSTLKSSPLSCDDIL